MKERYYTVGFLTKKKGCYQWTMIVRACNQKQAIEKARQLWKGPHQFHIWASRQDKCPEDVQEGVHSREICRDSLNYGKPIGGK